MSLDHAAIFRVIVRTDEPLTEEQRDHCIGVMGNSVTELLRDHGVDPMVTIEDRGAV